MEHSWNVHVLTLCLSISRCLSLTLLLPLTGNFLTRSRRFHRLVDWAFSVCDSRRKGAIGESELYAGLLLVHLNLAKWAGPAACFVSLLVGDLLCVAVWVERLTAEPLFYFFATTVSAVWVVLGLGLSVLLLFSLLHDEP
jgi:hypothetical protein